MINTLTPAAAAAAARAAYARGVMWAGDRDPADRREHVARCVERHGVIRVADLADRFDVVVGVMMNDLAVLWMDGRVAIHGCGDLAEVQVCGGDREVPAVPPPGFKHRPRSAKAGSNEAA